MKLLLLFCAFGSMLALGIGAAALADNPHPPGCKGDPHKCLPTPPPLTTTNTVTVVQPCGPACVTTVPVTTLTPSTVSVQVTTPVSVVTFPASKTPTSVVVKTKLKISRRWCTRQRHGWRCYKKRPPYAPHH